MLPVILVAENVRSLHNLGAIFRTADAVGLQEIVLCGLSARPPRPEIEKTALGATRTVPWQYRLSPAAYLAEMAGKGWQLAALEQTASAEDLFQAELSFPLVLVVGHERQGVSPESLALCRRHLQIPMQGRSARSLNVSTAAGIALYELRRRLCYHGEVPNLLA